jgi:uncharacterized repeat protein (TIGR01451 family)
MSASPSTVFVGSNVVYSLTVSNAGPSPAQNVVISQSLPPGVTDVIVTNNSVSVSQSGSNLSMSLASLPVYGAATVSVSATFTPNTLGTKAAVLVTSVASVTSSVTGPNPGNTTASATVLVTEPMADLAVSMTGSPSSVLQGALLTYTIIVTNNGPFTADDVTLATTLPANANFISATASQGTLYLNGTFGELGNIPLGTNVVVTIVVSPTITRNITASTTVSLGANSFEYDPDTFNNTASVSTTVGLAADLGVTALATSPALAGRPMSYWVTVSNAGPSPATGLVFSQSLPAGCTLLSSGLLGHTVANNVITGTITNLASGSNTTFYDEVETPTLPAGTQSNLISTFSVFGQPGDPNLSNNVFTLTTVLEPPTVTIVAAGATVTSGSVNGSVGTNGTYSVQLFLQNEGNISTTNLVATLQTNSGVTPVSGSNTYDYQVLRPEAPPANGQYSFISSGTNGGDILAVLQLQDGANNLGTVTFTFVMPVVQTFWNTNFISIPNQKYIPDPDSGPANPYPSAIVVSNVNGDVSTVTVTVSNLIHSYPNDIGMLLVGPTGANCVLMSAAAQYSTMTVPATITFNQNTNLPVLPAEGGEIVSGSYQPADYYASQNSTTETFSNSPVPVGPYNTNLAVFASLLANGTWSLYVEDDTPGNTGAISNGWGLAFTIITPVNQMADLAASIVALTNQVVLGNCITNIWTVTDNGPDAVTNVFVTNILSAGLALLTNTLPPGASIIQTSPAYVCNLRSLISGGSALVTNVVATISDGLQTNEISVGSTVLDDNPANNTASVVTLVNPPPADLAVGPISVAPNPVALDGNLVYTLYVTNNGPSNALNVVGVFTNLSNLLLVSANPSQGNCVTYTNSVQCNLGAISNGHFAVVVLTATATNTGVLTNEWSVTNTLGVDTNLSNNSTTVQVTVTLPMAVITNGPATLLAQGSPPFNGAINSNQTNTVSFTLLNIGSAPTTNLVATLLANSGIRPITVSQVYGPIAVGGSASGSYAFVGSGSSGATITAELSLQDGSNTNLGPVFYTFMIPMTQCFSNSGTITIPYIGTASPYPSGILVSGLTNGLTNLLVSKVTAALNGFTHSWPHDVEAVLVSPAGQELVLMEHTGAFYSVTNLVLTFDDAAAQSLPLNSALFSGTFLATQYTNYNGSFDVLPVITNGPAANTNLAVFNGANPNGIWSLYVYDDMQGNDGVITSGWSLGLTAVSPVNTTPVNNESPSWTNIVISAGGVFQATLNGSVDQSYAIQSSSNLVSWTSISTNTGTFIFTNAITNAPLQFYRAMQLPQ